MSRAIDLGSDAYPCANGAAIPQRRIVVFDPSNKGNAKLPAGTPEKAVIGVTKEAQSKGNMIAVQLEGIARVESDGSAVINPGDFLTVVGTTGQVKTQAIAAGTANSYNIVGQCVDRSQIPATAGAVVSMRILIMPQIVAA